MGRVDSVADRRFALLTLVMYAQALREGRRSTRRWAARVVPDACARVGCRWTGGFDRDWILRELGEVKARPGDYTEESYERWRLMGMPIWAALAAGMTPTPGSRKLIGRRPDLP